MLLDGRVFVRLATSKVENAGGAKGLKVSSINNTVYPFVPAKL